MGSKEKVILEKAYRCGQSDLQLDFFTPSLRILDIFTIWVHTFNHVDNL